MVDYLEIAIADVLKHPSLGLVSHQPILTSPCEDRIRVMDIRGNIHYVMASECTKDYTEAEFRDYWIKVGRI